ncbi:UNVERIFIED_CONTAM: hypothetical protein FKN15_030439 [Acipenser sinensis]
MYLSPGSGGLNPNVSVTWLRRSQPQCICHLAQKVSTPMYLSPGSGGLNPNVSVSWRTAATLGLVCSLASRGHSGAVRPLHRLTEKGGWLAWDTDCAAAFGRLREAFVTAPVLASPTPWTRTQATPGSVPAQEGLDRELVVAYSCVTRWYQLTVVRTETSASGGFPSSPGDHAPTLHFTVSDYFTNAIPDQRATTCAEALLDGMFSRFGVAEELQFGEVCRQLGIKKTWTTPLQLQGNGLVEWFAIQDQYLPLVLMAYQTAVQESTGCTSAALFGRELATPVDLVFGRLSQHHTPELAGLEYLQQLQDWLDTAHAFPRLLQRQEQQAEYCPHYPDMKTWLCNPDHHESDLGSEDKESETADSPACSRSRGLKIPLMYSE